MPYLSIKNAGHFTPTSVSFRRLDKTLLHFFIQKGLRMHKAYRGLKIAVIATMLASATSGYSYLDRHEAVKESTSIICRLFTYSKLESSSQEKLNDFIQDFTKNTFSYGVSYSQFNEENVASMVIDSAAEWIAQQAMGVALREVMTDSKFNPHFNGANYFNQEALKKAIHRALLAQVKRVTKKPLELVNCGDFNGFIGNGLRTKVRDQISAMIARDCGAYCGDTGTKMLLYCGHMLHKTCAEQMQRPLKCPQCRDSLEYLFPKPAPVYQPKPTPQPAYQPTAPAPVYQPAAAAPKDAWTEFFISIGILRKD